MLDFLGVLQSGLHHGGVRLTFPWRDGDAVRAGEQPVGTGMPKAGYVLVCAAVPEPMALKHTAVTTPLPITMEDRLVPIESGAGSLPKLTESSHREPHLCESGNVHTNNCKRSQPLAVLHIEMSAVSRV